MTRIVLNRILLFVILFYIIVVLLAFHLNLNVSNQKYYTTLKELLPIIFAIPAAYIVFCFQRRNEYLKALRSVYSLLVEVYTDFMDYSYCQEKNDERYFKLKSCISKAIEEIRSVYENIDEIFDEDEGLYPFEPLKEIYHIDLEKLHNGDFTFETNKQIRTTHYKKWKEIRINFIVELERTQTSFPVTKHKRKSIGTYGSMIKMFKKFKQNFIGNKRDPKQTINNKMNK
ncbi:MAG: hypothetical protein JNL49_08490 [Bacteroidia bacterium]|nr:hypothetical protein [Bacteroidia bacterium]